MMKTLPLVVFLAMTLAACGGDTTTPAPSQATINMSGTWTGTITDSLAGRGTLRFSLSQSGSSVTGTYASTYGSINSGGSFTGTIAGASLSGTVTPSVVGTCPSTVAATVTSSVLSGTFASFNCTVAETGSFSVTKS